MTFIKEQIAFLELSYKMLISLNLCLHDLKKSKKVYLESNMNNLKLIKKKKNIMNSEKFNSMKNESVSYLESLLIKNNDLYKFVIKKILKEYKKL